MIKWLNLSTSWCYQRAIRNKKFNVVVAHYASVCAPMWRYT
jgi:hypothetical protein